MSSTYLSQTDDGFGVVTRAFYSKCSMYSLATIGENGDPSQRHVSVCKTLPLYTKYVVFTTPEEGPSWPKAREALEYPVSATV